MENILTPEEKKYLRFYAKYIKSYGEDETTFRIYDWTPDYRKIVGKLNSEENYYLEIPERIGPILNRISESLASYEPSYESDDISETWANFIINSYNNSIEVQFCYSYQTKEDAPMSWDKEEIKDDENLSKIMDELSESSLQTLTVYFNGGGDSGQIEEARDENGIERNLSAAIEEWCYNQLESNYGGWEINEGSSGSFKFYVRQKEVILDFGWYNENSEMDTIYEEKFDK